MYKTLIVIDKNVAELPSELTDTIYFDTYLREYPKLDEPATRVVNLCDTGKYLSEGYYCSLLAEARQHRVLPSVKTINDMRSGVTHLVNQRLFSKAELALLPVSKINELLIYMGVAENAAFQSLAKTLFQRFPVPILRVTFNDEKSQFMVERRCYADLNPEQQITCMETLKSQGASRWYRSQAQKQFRWAMAILVNPEEKVPPSDKGALNRFVKAAAKLGIEAKLVQASELVDINQYDALFIRETTAIDHYTYRLACEAEANGIVVFDDPESILRCCNKVFLHDSFSYQNVPSPRTMVVDDASDSTLDLLEQKFEYPMVLKMPEGSFSRGVYKVKERSALSEQLQTLLQDSALALVQEYIYTEYDWRVGVLNGRAIFACRYFMAKNHWQIYNHSSKRNFSGGFDCFPTYEIPKKVLEAALKASKAIGNGLYGVDIKYRDEQAYVIEVNDNPSIDHKVEDSFIGDELYMQIMAEFLRRLELRGR